MWTPSALRAATLLCSTARQASSLHQGFGGGGTDLVHLLNLPACSRPAQDERVCCKAWWRRLGQLHLTGGELLGQCHVWLTILLRHSSTMMDVMRGSLSRHETRQACCGTI